MFQTTVFNVCILATPINKLILISNITQEFSGAAHCCNIIQTSVAYIRTHLPPERAEQTRSETVVGSIRHQVGQTLTEKMEKRH